MTADEKKANLAKRVNRLCDILNASEFHDYSYYNEDTGKNEWRIIVDPLTTFQGGICYNREVYNFLKKNNYIDSNVCWKCGEEPISNKYTFTAGTRHHVQHSICLDCYNEDQQLRSLSNKGQSLTNGNTNCYIATVCYGNINAMEVEILRNYRDQYLQHYFVGKYFIRIYYLIAPFVSKFMKDKFKLNRLIRIYILDRIVSQIQKNKKLKS